MAKDKIHDAVKNALVKDGWTITAEPRMIRYGDVTVYADLEATRAPSAEVAKRIVVVEIKSFGSPSPVDDLEKALGQYLVYRGLLDQVAPDSELYLAVNELVFNDFFQRSGVKLLVELNAVAMLVVDVSAEEIVRWTS